MLAISLAVYNFVNIVFQVDLLFKVYGRDVVIVIFILITSLIMSRSIVICDKPWKSCAIYIDLYYIYHKIQSWPFNRQIIQSEFSPTWSCVSLTRSTTSSEWKLLLIGIYRILIGIYRIVTGIYRLLFGIYRIVIGIYRILISIYRIVIGIYRILIGIYRI